MESERTKPYLDSSEIVSGEALRVHVIEGPDRGVERDVSAGLLTVGSASDNHLVLSDETVSRYHADLEPHPAGVLVKDNGSTNGTFVGSVQLQSAVVPPGSVLTLGRTRLEIAKSIGRPPTLFPGRELCGVCGSSASMRQVMAQLQRIGPSQASVLIIGESGTGKELLARALHELNERAAGPLITVDCGTLTPTLVASELFGHERGAFTGADRQHVGALERAKGGTLFLDEIGELPLDLQPMLLGALERRRIRRVGGKQDIPIDVRVVSATHRDLRKSVNNGQFRLDLYYRLAVVVLRVPALREHPDDIPELVDRFLVEAGAHETRRDLFSEAQMHDLMRHHWPGNVRELRNVVEATLALGAPPPPEPPMEGAPGEGEFPVEGLVLDAPYKDARDQLLREFERRYVGYWLDRAGGNVARASRLCRMDRSHLFQLLRRHGLR